ncbi:helix-turn-helix domain-containing protein [Streptomyces sp. SID3343]|nr:helix-turn-helix domain-containing protein [Streptomyces sp. SID3343]
MSNSSSAEPDFSPARSIRDARLGEAGRMLADPRQRHRSIASVAHSVGIGNPDVLPRAYRNRYGTTPSEYRHDHAAEAG